MPDPTERYIKIYDFAVAPARVHGGPTSERKPADFGPLRDAVRAATANGTPLCDDEDSRGRRLYLMDMEVNGREGYVAFVWTLADRSAATQMFLRRGANALRVAERGDDEDVAVSAHMAIDFESALEQMRYRTALEDNEGISRGRVASVLQTLLRVYMPSVTAVLDEGLSKEGPPKVILDAHPGRMIGDTEAKPVEIEVVKLIPRRTLLADSANPYYEASDRRVFKLGRDGLASELAERALEEVRRLRKAFPNYRTRIRWRDPEEQRITEVTQIDPLDHPERLLERALTRMICLSGFRNLPDATSELVPRLVGRMVKSLRETAVEERRRR